MQLVDPADLATDRILKNLQGNTIKGHGRDHTTHIFVTFNKGRIKAVKTWIRDFAANTDSRMILLPHRSRFE